MTTETTIRSVFEFAYPNSEGILFILGGRTLYASTPMVEGFSFTCAPEAFCAHLGISSLEGFEELTPLSSLETFLTHAAASSLDEFEGNSLFCDYTIEDNTFKVSSVRVLAPSGFWIYLENYFADFDMWATI